MLCAPLDWQYAELPSSASDAVLCSVFVRKMWTSNQIEKEKKKLFTSGYHKLLDSMEYIVYSTSIVWCPEAASTCLPLEITDMARPLMFVGF